MRLRAVLWLHSLRLRKYVLSLFSNALTDALWALIPIVGALAVGRQSSVAEIFWAMVAWMVIANSAWLIGGWLEYAALLGVLEYHVHASVSPLALAAGRVVTLLASVSISSAIVIAPLALLGLAPAAADTWSLAASLALLLAQAVAYGVLLAAVSVKVGVPSALLDIASLAQLGLLLLPLNPEHIGALSLIPLLGPAYLARYSARTAHASPLLAHAAAVAAAIMLLALLAEKWSSKLIAQRGFRAVSFV
ncbi:MAG: hypothetical protein QXW88_01530 [Thermofilum sp.]